MNDALTKTIRPLIMLPKSNVKILPQNKNRAKPLKRLAPLKNYRKKNNYKFSVWTILTVNHPYFLAFPVHYSLFCSGYTL